MIKANILKQALLLVVIGFGLLASTASAQFMPSFNNQSAEPDVFIWGARSSSDGQVGIMVRLPEPWKTYWKTPGEGGSLPSIEWKEKANVDNWQWHWPTPLRLQSGDIPILGYENNVFFPLTFKPVDPQEDIVLKGEFTLPMCTTICTYHTFDFDLTLTPQTPMSHNQKESWDGYWADSPLEADEDLTYDWQLNGDDATLTIHYTGNDIIDAFVFQDPQGVLPFQFSEPTQTDESIIISATSWGNLPETLPDNLGVQIKSNSGEMVYPIIPKTASSSIDGLTWWAWVFAFGGGFILNFMPCVLPVLGMKLNSLIVSDNPTLVRRQLLYSGSGVIGTFIVIGIALSLLKISGHQIGWGIQFQNPWFLGALVLLVSGFAVSLLVGMNWLLPRGIMDKLSTAGNDKPIGHVIQGVTATLLATPCTAPMLGTAIGFALATSPVLSVTLFAVIGLGMAFPWFAVALYPPAQKIMPKPGPWLAWVKPIFGIGMLITAIWLASIWWQYHGSDQEISQDEHWSVFSQELLDYHVDQGDTVLVDITAAWCMTCKSNKALVLNTEDINDFLDREDVVLLQGDWTRQDDAITEYIQSHGKYGIPLNVVYGPSAKDGIVLNEILTSTQVKNAVQQASD